MKKFYFVLIFLLSFGFYLNLALAKEVVIASGHPEYPPFMYQKGSEIVGICADVTRLVFQRMGLEVQLKAEGPWDVVQEKSKKGLIDVLIGIYPTPERKKYFNYSIGYLDDPVVVFVQTQKPFQFHTLNDLIGKVGTTTKGDSWGVTFDAFIPKLNLQPEITVEKNLNKLLSGKADYFVFALYPGLYYSNHLKITNQIRYLQPNIDTPILHLAISKKSKYADRIPEMNKILKDLIADGTVQKLVQKSSVP